ncbi:hypothetical protein AM587_10004735 [Phytophthora nicotianae]|uniref:Uncharacterized protein n=1 Tax=Phytophthora nicotianae TaxID=4792 RepID=A0A0W8DYY4_PHYNI|nr:hypothetical protein AM587_10004735 [Phytophthora nicotianae]
MVQVSKPLVIAGVSAVAAAALLIFALARNGSSSDAKKEKKEDGVREVPNLHKEQLLSILETICTQMGQVVMQLAKLEAKIRQESSQSGRSLPEDQLASYLMGQFEEAMKAIESQVYAKFQTTEDEVKVATEYFEEEDDKDVANAVAKLQELYRVMTGGGFSDVEVPSELTLTKFIEIMQETMESLNVAMEEVCLEVKELNPDNKEEAINQRYVKRADNLSAEIHAKHGLTREVLQAAMMKYQQEPAFLMAMTELQQQQAERFAAAAAIFNAPNSRNSTELFDPDESIEKKWRAQFHDLRKPCIEGDHVDRTKVLHNMMKKTLHDDEQSPLFLWGLPREHILEFIRQSVLPSSWIHPSRRPVSEWEAVTNEEDEVAQVRRAVIQRFIAELRADPTLWAAFQNEVEQIQQQYRQKNHTGDKIRENKERAKSPRSPDEHELKYVRYSSTLTNIESGLTDPNVCARKKQTAERMERTHRHREQIIQLEDEKLAAKREAYLRKVNPDRQLPASELEQTPRYRRRKAWLHVVSFAAISHHWHQELVQTKNLMAMAKVEGVAACIIQKIWRKWKWQHASKHTVVVYTWLRKCLWKLLLRVRCRRKARNAALLRLFMQDQYSQSHAKKNFTRVMIQWRGKVIRAQKAGMSFINCNRARLQALSIWWENVDHERQRTERQHNMDERRLTARKDSSSGSAPGSAGAHRSRAGSVAILGGMDEKLANMQMLITPVELQRLQQTSAQVVKIPKSIKWQLLTEFLTESRKEFRRKLQAYKEEILCASYAREVKLEEARAIVQGSLNWEEATDNRGNAITSSTSKAAHPSPCFVLFSNPNGAKTMEYLVRRGIQLTLDADPELRALVARQQEHRLSSSRRPSVSFNGVSAGSPSPRRYSILKKPTQTLLMPLPPSVLAINSDTNTTTPDSPSHSKAF